MSEFWHEGGDGEIKMFDQIKAFEFSLALESDCIFNFPPLRKNF